ncbi:MAG: endonuclease III domain-containing protein [Acidobacteriales bacterium]|nr:endonuclease III domain-containing protein [Terriglobales bacterium]
MYKQVKTADPLHAHVSALFDHFGQQNWWPGRSRFEVVVGAVLTQNTSWNNVEKALANLRRAKVLTLAGVRDVPIESLEILLRPSGYFRQKARRLKGFVRFLDDTYGGSLTRMFARPTDALRAELLALNGIGPETADSILVYAGGHPVFVVDAYARRILERHELLDHVPKSARYDEIRRAVESAVHGSRFKTMNRARLAPRHRASPMSRAETSATAQAYNELHAMIVRVGNDHCRSTPNCAGCPLEPLLPAKQRRKLTTRLSQKHP